MPNFDGTGPNGLGEITGRGFGTCVKVIKNGSKSVASLIGLGRGGSPRGGGRGRGFGGGRNRNS